MSTQAIRTKLHTHAAPKTGEHARGGVADSVSYWLAGASIYLTFGLLFFFSAKEKLFEGGAEMPAALAKTFHGTFVASFPGTNASWVMIGLLEAAVFLVIVASLLSGEFLPTRRKPLLLSGLGLSMFTFACIAWGENLTGQYATVAELFEYLVGTAVLMALVLIMPPYRSAAWLSGIGAAADAGDDQ